MLRRKFHLLVLLLTACGLAGAQTPLHIPANPNPNLYPADANPQKEIAEAIAQASKTNKRILLVFGANWCGDCHALDYAFHQPRIEPLLNANFKVVHIDIGGHDSDLKNLDLVKKYRVDLEKGIPSIAVLDGKGAWMDSTAAFESARHMTEEDVIAFLNSWKPPSQQAQK